MPALLCETVTGRSMAELVAGRDAARSADMIELRLDGVVDADVAGALDGRRMPAIITCRPTWEGGRFDGSEEERRRLLVEALACGAEYIDVEWRALRDDPGLGGFDDAVRAQRSRVIVSTHDFDRPPADASARARAMRATGAAMIKLAFPARRLSDTLPLLDVAREGDAVVIGMGDAGVPSRLLATRFGSRWTYAGAAVAPGQMPASQMIEDFRFRCVSASTTLYGATGADVMRSRVPHRLNAAFAEAGLDAVCVPLCPADADDLRAFKSALGFAGIVDASASAEAVDRVLTAWTGQKVR